MEQAAEAFSVFTFAATLASLTAPPVSGPALSDGLEDDVAVFSYEAALDGSARRRAGASCDASVEDDVDYGAIGGGMPITEVDGIKRLAQDRKRASITIRLSEAECAQLRARAVEAGMTVSAYLRSCTLEVENLRTQVKEALAHLRAEPTREMRLATAVEPSSAVTTQKKRRAAPATEKVSGRWFAKIWPRSRTAPETA